MAILRAREGAVVDAAPIAARATSIGHEYDIDTAQVTLGHSQPDKTSIEAERSFTKARTVMVQIG